VKEKDQSLSIDTAARQRAIDAAEPNGHAVRKRDRAAARLAQLVDGLSDFERVHFDRFPRSAWAGFREDEWSRSSGRNRPGKRLVLQVIAQAQATGGTAALIDSEHALDANYARKPGVDVELGRVAAGLRRAGVRDHGCAGRIGWNRCGSGRLSGGAGTQG